VNQHSLFDPTTTTVAACPVCGATRQPHEQKAPACTVDRDRNAGVHPYPRRPAGCLNQIDNATTAWPNGY
jgi:hypothetical protein